jgi:hypothetical protein
MPESFADSELAGLLTPRDRIDMLLMDLDREFGVVDMFPAEVHGQGNEHRHATGRLSPPSTPSRGEWTRSADWLMSYWISNWRNNWKYFTKGDTDGADEDGDEE